MTYDEYNKLPVTFNDGSLVELRWLKEKSTDDLKKFWDYATANEGPTREIWALRDVIIYLPKIPLKVFHSLNIQSRVLPRDRGLERRIEIYDDQHYVTDV